MDIKKTERGFDLASFEDRNGCECSLQKSSIATEDAIWLGIDNPKLTIFADESMGKYEIVEMPKLYMVDSRMHLTRFQVMQLLPALTTFVHTGELIQKTSHVLEDVHSEDGIVENLLYDAEWMDLDDMEKSVEFIKAKYTITRNPNFDHGK